MLTRGDPEACDGFRGCKISLLNPAFFFSGLWNNELSVEVIPLEEVKDLWEQCSHFRPTKVLTKSLFQSFGKCLPTLFLSSGFLRLCLWPQFTLLLGLNGLGGWQYLGCGHTPWWGCYTVWLYMNFSSLGGLPGSLMLLIGFWAPALKPALTGQCESLTSCLTKLVPGSEKREAITTASFVLLQVDRAARVLEHRKTWVNRFQIAI